MIMAGLGPKKKKESGKPELVSQQKYLLTISAL